MTASHGIRFPAVAILLLAGTCPAARRPAPAKPTPAPSVEKLWPDDAPELNNAREQDRPALTICLPAKDKAVGSAVVICPGGGYGHLAMDHEGHQVARWLNSLGVAGFILKYRHRRNGFGHPAPLRDAQRAVATVRRRAGEFGVDPDRIGIMGFSAGGHLASTAGTHFHAGKPDAPDPLDRVSCRPDFMILVYPVISMSEPFTHAGSKRNLLGPKPDPKLAESLSNERQVTPRTPPAFLVHSTEDRVVPVENSVRFYLALRRAKVPAEMHLYAKGRHGFGLGVRGCPPATATWPATCEAWLRARGLLTRKEAPTGSGPPG